MVGQITSPAFLDRLKAGDTAAIARAISIMEAGGRIAASLHQALLPGTGRALTIGVTGPPGAGKSTLIDTFVARLRKANKTVAIAAVDPSSPLSGGAVLGDRVRMGQHTEDAGVFIRSIASRGHLGGLSEGIQGIVDVLDYSGRDIVVVETVGAGQSEVEIVEVADVKIVVNAPGLGDDVQAIKAGILEIADILVVNKADLPLAARTVRQLRSMLALRYNDRKNIPVIETIASSGKGLDELVTTALGFESRSPTERLRRRRMRIRRLVADAAAAETKTEILSNNDEYLLSVIEDVERGQITTLQAGRMLLDFRLAERAVSIENFKRNEFAQ